MAKPDSVGSIGQRTTGGVVSRGGEGISRASCAPALEWHTSRSAQAPRKLLADFVNQPCIRRSLLPGVWVRASIGGEVSGIVPHGLCGINGGRHGGKLNSYMVLRNRGNRCCAALRPARSNRLET